MAHCTQCGEHLLQEHRFCKRCGTPRSGSTAMHRNAGGHHPRSAPLPGAKTPAGQAAIEAIEARHARSKTTTLFGGLVCWAVVPIAVTIGQMPTEAFLIGSVVVALLTAMVYQGCSNWSESEYYQVPGSRDANGEHRCIHCGHRGIYRHGQYKSNAEFADCSKCKTNLWVG